MSIDVTAPTGIGAERSDRPDAAAPVAAHATWRGVVGDALCVAAACAGEIAILTALASGIIGLGLGTLAHLGIVAGLGARIFAVSGQPRRDTLGLQLATLLTLIAGPVGAGIGAIATLALSRTATASPLLDAWYERIAQSARRDPVDELCDTVAIGRALDLSAPPPETFTRIIREGSLAERQAALGLIARAYDPAYIGALKLALTSPEPVIRVQAAAVAARVREGIAEGLSEAIEAADCATGRVTQLRILLRIEAAVRSGLVDQALSARGREAGDLLTGRIVDLASSAEAGIAAARLARSRGKTGVADGQHLLERYRAALADNGRWGALRASATAVDAVRRCEGARLRSRRRRRSAP